MTNHEDPKFSIKKWTETDLSYFYDDQLYCFDCNDLTLKGYKYKRNKELQCRIWHDPCNRPVTHIFSILPHENLSVDERSYRDRTSASKNIAKQTMSNKMVGVFVGSITAILCACLALIIREYDPNNIKNYKKESIVHLSSADQKFIIEYSQSLEEYNKRLFSIERNVTRIKGHFLNELRKCKHGN